MLRRRRFGLKALFVAVLCLSMPCAWLAYEAARFRRQRAAVQEIESMPGGVFYDYFYDGDPGQDRIATDPVATRQTINKYIQELVRAQLVSIRQRGMGGTAIYTLHEIVDKSGQGDS